MESVSGVCSVNGFGSFSIFIKRGSVLVLDHTVDGRLADVQHPRHFQYIAFVFVEVML